MGRDKAGIAIDGRSQLERAFGLIEHLVARSFVSVRADQQDDPLRAAFRRSSMPGRIEGPHGRHPRRAAGAPRGGVAGAGRATCPCWMPPTLQNLIARRDPARLATAYRSSHDGLPEPLCAIYEPAAAQALAACIASGRNCPRKFLIQSDTLLLDQPNPQSLDNVNTPAELAAATSASHAGNAAPRELRVQYFALLREQAGRRDEAVLTRAATPRELFAELAARHRFTLGTEHLKVAVNTEFADWSRPLAAGDTVVFIPPVAGG